jgi:hypothetical protein
MIVPTRTTLDNVLTMDGSRIGGFPSKHIAVLAQHDTGVGATFICCNMAQSVADRDETTLWFDLSSGIPAELRVLNNIITVSPGMGSADTYCHLAAQFLNTGEVRLVIVDSTLGLNSDNLTGDLLKHLPQLKTLCVQNDALLVFVAHSYYDQRYETDRAVGAAAWERHASYVIDLLPEWVASCAWSPVGGTFDAQRWEHEPRSNSVH